MTEVPGSLVDVPMLSSRVPWNYIVGFPRHVMGLLAHVPDTWPRLRDLFENKCIPVRGAAPGLLELAGVAIREEDTLRIASPLVRELLEPHINDRWFADLHARDRNWDEAFRGYGKLQPDQRARINSIEELPDTTILVKGLCAAMHSAAVDGPEEVKRLLIEGCEKMLGTLPVSFWHHGKSWELEPGTDVSSPERIRREVLPAGGSFLVGVLPVLSEYQSRVVAAVIPAARSDQRAAVVVGELETEGEMGVEGRRLVAELVEHFVVASAAALDIQRTRHRLRVLKEYDKIVNDIVACLGSTVQSVGDALQKAAAGLRRVGYRRVFFCLVNEKKTHIRGVLQDPDDDVDLVEMTDWPLDEPKADVQPFVVHTGEPMIIEDASTHPLTNKSVVAVAQQTSEAIVPLLTPGDTVLGTIHVERADGAVPMQEEVADLMEFGRQLTIAIKQNTRVRTLSKTLDGLPGPVMIFDAQERLRFANRPAAESLDVPCGLRSIDDASTAPQLDAFQDCLTYSHGDKSQLKESLSKRRRLVRHAEVRSNDGSVHSAAVWTNVITNWRDETSGAFCYLQDQSYLARVFNALRCLHRGHDTEAVLRSVLKAIRALGHKWARLYRVSSRDPSAFVSKDCFGMEDTPFQDKFKQGDIELHSWKQEGHESGVCVQQKSPHVFCCFEEYLNGAEVVTPQGLRATNIQEPQCPDGLGKMPGDFWIDYPLITENEVLGKVTLDCDAEYRPEDFEFLKVLCLLTTDLLSNSLRWEQVAWVREAAERAIADTSHHLVSWFAGLPVLLTRYRRLEKSMPKLASLNADYQHLCESYLSTIRHTTDRLAPFVAHRNRTDLLQVLQRELKVSLVKGMWKLSCQDGDVKSDVDEHLLRNALLELIENSRQAAGDPNSVQIRVSVSIVENNGQPFVSIEYEDNGPGVSDDLKERIFDNFFSHRPGAEAGTGLGLGYVRRVFQSHGGEIRECGKSGRGARFVIEFPQFVHASVDKER